MKNLTSMGILFGKSKNMLNKQVVKEFLQSDLEGIEIPQNINFDDLVDVFIDYCEDDYYEWFKDNAKSFFSGDNGADWDSISEKIQKKKQLQS